MEKLWLHLPVDISQVHFNGQRVFGVLEVLEGMFLTGPPARHMTAQQTGLHKGRGGHFSLSFSHGIERVYTNCSKPSHSMRRLTQTLSVVPHSQQTHPDTLGGATLTTDSPRHSRWYHTHNRLTQTLSVVPHSQHPDTLGGATLTTDSPRHSQWCHTHNSSSCEGSGTTCREPV